MHLSEGTQRKLQPGVWLPRQGPVPNRGMSCRACPAKEQEHGNGTNLSCAYVAHVYVIPVPLSPRSLRLLLRHFSSAYFSSSCPPSGQSTLAHTTRHYATLKLSDPPLPTSCCLSDPIFLLVLVWSTSRRRRTGNGAVRNSTPIVAETDQEAFLVSCPNGSRTAHGNRATEIRTPQQRTAGSASAQTDADARASEMHVQSARAILRRAAASEKNNPPKTDKQIRTRPRPAVYLWYPVLSMSSPCEPYRPLPFCHLHVVICCVLRLFLHRRGPAGKPWRRCGVLRLMILRHWQTTAAGRSSSRQTTWTLPRPTSMSQVHLLFIFPSC